MELKTYYITFDPDLFESGIDMIAITGNPAIETYALRFKKEELIDPLPVKFSINHEKHLIIGPAMIPDKPIYRREGDHEFNVVFTQEVIDQMLEKFKSEQRAIQFNFEHDENQTILGFVKEAWIVEDSEKDKSALYGFNLPVGTLMISAKIQDVDAWETVIKQMDQVGFSVEGIMGIKQFTQITKQNKKQEMKKNKKRVFATKLTSKRKYNKTLRKYEDVEITEEKEVLIVEDLEVDSTVEVLTDEGAIEVAPDGEYIIEDEEVIIVVEDGVITETEEIAEPVAEEDSEGMFAEEETEEETEEERIAREAEEAKAKEEEEEFEEEVIVEEDAPVAVNAETLAKLVELETRLDALEAALAADQEEEAEAAMFSKQTKTDRLSLLKTLFEK